MSDLSNFLEKQIQNEEFRKEYYALTPKYEIIKEIVREKCTKLNPKGICW